MDRVVTALTEQLAETSSLLNSLSVDEWQAPTRCDGWTVADVVLHLTQSDEMAIASLGGNLPSGTTDSARWGGGLSVDESVALMVEQERGVSSSELLTRWMSSADQLVTVLGGMDLSTRVRWVAGTLSARTLATTRMSETWIHFGDIASAVGVTPMATDRLELIARLAWRTLPYAFGMAGKSMSGPVAFLLVSPSGRRWDFVPDEPAATTITGPAVELCEVAARRLDPDATSLRGEGPDASDVLDLVRTYA